MSIKITIDATVKKQHKKMERFCGGFRSLNHYYSSVFQNKYDNVIGAYPSAESSNMISVEVELYSSAYSKDKFSRDTFRLLGDIERFIFVNMRVTPIGYDATFNDANKSIKTIFYFLNFNRMDDQYRFVSMSDSKQLDINNKIKARVGDSKTIGFDKTQQLETLEGSGVRAVEIPYSDRMATSLSELVTLLGEPDYRVAMQRALKGLDKYQADKLLVALNRIIGLSSDCSVDDLDMPKKHSKTNSECRFDDKSLDLVIK